MRDEYDPNVALAPAPPPLEKTEPAYVEGAKTVVSFILAVIAIAALFGYVPVLGPDEQAVIRDNLMAVFVGLLTLLSIVQGWVQAWRTRKKVYAPATVQEIAAVNVRRGYDAVLVGNPPPTPVVAPSVE